METTERARMISALITPSGLFEWLRMPFRLNNDAQIYQRLIDNVLCGYLKTGENMDSAATGLSKLIEVFTKGEPETDRTPSVWADDLSLTTY